MKDTTADIRELLSKSSLKAIELIELYITSPFTTPDYRFARYNEDVVFGGNTYRALAFTRSPISWSASQQDQKVTLQFDNADMTFGQLLFTREVSGGRLRLR